MSQAHKTSTLIIITSSKIYPNVYINKQYLFELCHKYKPINPHKYTKIAYSSASSTNYFKKPTM